MLQVPAWKLGLRGQVLGREALPRLLPLWEDLCTRTAEDNVYYAPRYALALLGTVERGRKVDFAVVFDGERLVALLPITRSRLPIPGLQPAGRAWQSLYTFNCMPLLDAELRAEAADALTGLLLSLRAGEWVIPAVNTSGEACIALTGALDRRELPWCFAGAFQRAVLDGGSSFEEHMKRCVTSKRRNDLARTRRRLEERGKVQHEVHCSGEGLDRAVAAFLRIESSGWKGQRGTALACDESSRAFAIRAFTGELAVSICRADVLSLDAVPVAVSLIVSSGRTAFSVKCAYDEEYRSYSVGLLLEVEVIRSFLSEGWADRLDSGTAGAHVIESLWPGRTEVADLMFSLSPVFPERRVVALRATEQWVRAAKAGLKRRMLAMKRP